jgi:hypothetical protein
MDTIETPKQVAGSDRKKRLRFNSIYTESSKTEASDSRLLSIFLIPARIRDSSNI